MYTIAYFSYTGNTKFLAEELNNNLNKSKANIFNIAFDKVENLNANKHLVIMFSIHAFNPPTEVVNFAKALPNAMFDYVSFIAVGCNSMWVNDAVTYELRNVFENKGYKVCLDRVVEMPLTLIKKFPREMGSSVIEKAKGKMIQISNDLRQGVVDNKVIPFKAKALNRIGRLEKHAAKLFGLELHANNNCISCGRCWNECPAKNIQPNKNQKPKFGFKCTMCLKCIYDCPTKSIKPKISKFIPVKDGYSIKEYINRD